MLKNKHLTPNLTEQRNIVRCKYQRPAITYTAPHYAYLELHHLIKGW